MRSSWPELGSADDSASALRESNRSVCSADGSSGPSALPSAACRARARRPRVRLVPRLALELGERVFELLHQLPLVAAADRLHQLLHARRELVDERVVVAARARALAPGSEREALALGSERGRVRGQARGRLGLARPRLLKVVERVVQ